MYVIIICDVTYYCGSTLLRYKIINDVALEHFPEKHTKKITDNINSSRLELQKRSFSRVGTLIWNSIDLNLRLSRKQTFKSKIHQALLTILKRASQ
jgi:hypothetical protein